MVSGEPLYVVQLSCSEHLYIASFTHGPDGLVSLFSATAAQQHSSHSSGSSTGVACGMYLDPPSLRPLLTTLITIIMRIRRK